MSTNYRLHIDPSDVLGISREATLQEIREAYRAKAKRYHPDAGGEEWAFRILSQAYEILSTARIARATELEESAPPRRSRPAPPEPPPPPPRHEPPPGPFGGEPRFQTRPRFDSHETVRPGIQEPAIDPLQVVDVEKVAIRFEADHVWLITDRNRENRFLSSCLNISWPDPESDRSPTTIHNAEPVLRSLAEVFAALSVQSQAVSSRSAVIDGRFTGWLSFSSDERAHAAFATLRQLLHDVGLVVKQWSRDLVIPRNWR